MGLQNRNTKFDCGYAAGAGCRESPVYQPASKVISVPIFENYSRKHPREARYRIGGRRPKWRKRKVSSETEYSVAARACDGEAGRWRRARSATAYRDARWPREAATPTSWIGWQFRQCGRHKSGPRKNAEADCRRPRATTRRSNATAPRDFKSAATASWSTLARAWN